MAKVQQGWKNPLLTALAMLTLTVASAGSAQQAEAIHVVRAGETLYGIAQKNGISTEQLMKLNGLSDGKIRPGQKISLPTGARGVATAGENKGAIALTIPNGQQMSEYTVAAGDTIYQMAMDRGMEPAELMAINDLTSTTVQIGQKLLLPPVITGGKPRRQTAGALPGYTPDARTKIVSPNPGQMSSGAQNSMLRTTASRYMDLPYVYGGNGNGGIDCSALTLSVLGSLGIRLPRTAAEQYQQGAQVDARNLREGDLVFFDIEGTGRVTHVGIYLNGGWMLNANSFYGKVVIEPLFSNSYWKIRYLGARRLLA